MGPLISPEIFAARWRTALEARARIIFKSGLLPDAGGNHCQIADAFVVSCGFAPIGYNWEMLDPEGGMADARSAIGVMAGAFAADLELPQTEWLGEVRAQACAADFVAMFDAAEAEPRMILSNRLEGLWNPVSDARIEWAFVGFDASRIALLLAMTPD
jgi:hypothetical protein